MKVESSRTIVSKPCQTDDQCNPMQDAEFQISQYVLHFLFRPRIQSCDLGLG